MPKSMLWAGLLFGILGLGALGGAFWFWSDNQSIVDGGIRTQGVVVDLEYRRDDDGSGTYAPVVEFRDEENSPHRHHSTYSSNPPAYDRGETVSIIYTPGNPERALIDDFWGRWGAILAMAILGAAFGATGFGIVYFALRRRRIVARLKRHGVALDAAFLNCYRDTSLTVGGRNPWRVEAQARHPFTGKDAVFLSDHIWVDLTDRLQGRDVRVLVDPTDPAHHFVDLSDHIEAD